MTDSPFLKNLLNSLARAFSQRAFAVAVALLTVCAIGLNAATEAMQLYFKKQPVPLAARLDDEKVGVPAKLGPWLQVTKDEPLDHTIQETLGTDQFVFRGYIDTRIVPEELVAEFQDKSTPEREAILSQVQLRHPEAVMRLAVTYYTGMVDTVAHIPDRCMIADGYEAKTYKVVSHQFTYPGGARQDIQFRFISFEDQSGTSRFNRNVTYFFHVNGHYESDPLGVRYSLQNLFQKYGYYAKIELMNILKDEDKGQAAMTDFLSSALPEIERCLPDWEKVTAKPVK